MKKNAYMIAFGLFLCVFLWKVILKGNLLGPFDLLAGFYHPYLAIEWHNSMLAQKSLHFKNYLLSDVVVVMLPFKLYGIELLKKLEVPLWNPYLFNGTPHLANVQSAVLYPFNVFYLIAPAQIAHQLYVVVQLILAFIFMFAYLQSLKLAKAAAYLGSFAFSFSAFFIGWLSWGTLGHAFLWLPLILYTIEKLDGRIEKKYAFLCVAGLVFSFFAGHTQTAIMVWATSLAYTFYRFKSNRHKLQSTLILFGLSLMIVCIQLIPTIEMYRESARDVFRTESFYKDQTIYFSSYLQSVFPDFFGNPVTRNWWGKMNYVESAIYFGLTALYFFLYQLMVTFKEKRKDIFVFFLGICIAGLILSTQNILSHLIFSLKIPLISSSTFSRYSALFILGATVVAAFGFDKYLKDTDKNQTGLINKTNILTLIFFGVYWLIIVSGFLPVDYKTNLSIIKRNSILPSLIMLSIILIPFITSRIERLKTLLPFIFILILTFELFRFSYKFTPFSPAQFFYPKHGLITKLQEVTKKDRYIGYFPANINAMYAVRGAEGGDPLYNKRIGELASLSEKGRVGLHDRAGVSFIDGPYKDRILDLFSVRYFVDKQDNFRNSWIDRHGKDNKAYDDRFREMWSDGIFKIYTNKYFMPRQKLFYTAEFMQNDSDVFNRLIADDFDYQKQVIVSEKVNGLNEVGEGNITIIQDDPHSQRYQINSTQPSLFVLTDAYYPGWNVSVDGEPGHIIRANHAFRAVFLDKGSHSVVFTYEPKSFKYGVMISVAGLCLLILYGFRLQKKHGSK